MKDSFLLCANWKMNKTPEEVRVFIRQMIQLTKLEQQKHFVFFAPAFSLHVFREELKGQHFSWGAQNCYFESAGAFTGENSPMVLKQMGATHCLVGHSERRQLFFEDDFLVEQKVRALSKHSIQPVVCVGENASEREQKKSIQVVEKQLSAFLKKGEDLTSPIIVAYEPVWSIGTGKSANLSQIDEMQKNIHQFSHSRGKKISLLYGGSVNKDNIRELASMEGIDGFLVGGASLDVKNFINLFERVLA